MSTSPVSTTIFVVVSVFLWLLLRHISLRSKVAVPPALVTTPKTSVPPPITAKLEVNPAASPAVKDAEQYNQNSRYISLSRSGREDSAVDGSDGGTACARWSITILNEPLAITLQACLRSWCFMSHCDTSSNCRDQNAYRRTRRHN